MNARGVALIAGLALLAAVSLLAVSATSAMLLQKQMAFNFTEGANALENSEVAMAYARAWLFSRANHEREAGCVSDCLLPVAFHHAGEIPALAEYESAAWWRANGLETGVNPVTGASEISISDGGSESSRWILEELYYQPAEGAWEAGMEGVGYYRILARGTGTHPSRVVVTEAIVARPWGENHELETFPPNSESGYFCKNFTADPPSPIDCGRLAWRQRR